MLIQAAYFECSLQSLRELEERKNQSEKCCLQSCLYNRTDRTLAAPRPHLAEDTGRTLAIV